MHNRRSQNFRRLARHRAGFVTLALTAIGLPTIIVLAAVTLDESRVRAAYAQATDALLVAYRKAGSQYSTKNATWKSAYPPPSNLICNFKYPASDEEESACTIEATNLNAMGSGAAADYSEVACDVAIDRLAENRGVFGFVSQDASDPQKGIRAQFGIVELSAASGGEVNVLGKSTARCGRGDIEEYGEEVAGMHVTDVATTFVTNVGTAALTVAVPAAGEQITSFTPKWFVGVIGIKVKRFIPIQAGDDDYIYAKFIAPLQVPAELEPS